MFQLWSFILLGLAFWCTKTDARAVNVSNTWTMPQEGLNVFYRFFRDRISWFEADAVCQFHHANLVTVDNSFQFDATRDLLRELDVNDIVWIGLMRPQSSERFMWSNSRPLVTDTGYWAESLPLMDAPLCAVIDPIRDYRWHALRCGGPETASFLCEMPVPSWADACILKDMPNLTMQYMADTASIELIRNCAEEGLLKQSCKGKQDRDRALHELICPRERLEAQRINDITNSHFKSLQIINSIRTDNNENNDIELLPLGETTYGGSGSNSDLSEQVPTEKNTVQRLIEQFNVDELMQADEPSLAMSGYHIPGEIPKPVKKAAKKVIVANGGDYQKKNRAVKYDEAIELPPPTPKPKKQQKMLALEDMMMGDQPQQSGEPEMLEHVGPEEDEVSNEIMEPLPHMKKVLPQDLKTMTPITEKSSGESMEQKQAHSLNEDVEGRAFVDITSAPVMTTTSSTAAPTITTTAATTTTATTTTSTTPAPITTTAAPSSTTVPILSTSTAIPTGYVEKDTKPTRNAHLSLNAHTIATTTHAPSITTIPPSSTAAPAHATKSEAHISSSSLLPSSTLAPHAIPKTNDFDVAVAGTDPAATIGHPIHPQQQQHGIITEELQHPHIKESVDNSHFIPPMLMVKSHYVPPLKHGEHTDTEHHVNDMTHAGHGDLQLTAGKPSDNPVYSMTANYSPTTTITNSHIANSKSDESKTERMTTTTFTTTMTAIKSTETTATTNDDEFTKKATDGRSSTLEQQPQYHKKQQTQLNAKLIDSSTSMTRNQEQQQQNEKQTDIKAHTPSTDEMAEKIENAEDIVANTNEHTTETAITTSISVANKLHSTAAITTTAADTTTTTTSASTATMKTADVDDVTHDDIEKPVKHRKPQTKDAEELTKEEIPMKTSKSTVKEETLLITTTTQTAIKMDEFLKIKETDATQKLMNADAKVMEREEEVTTGVTTKPQNDNLPTLAGVPSSSTTLAALTTTTSTNAATAEVTASTTTHTLTTTICNTDEDLVESTTTDAMVQSSAAVAGDGKMLTREHRTCQPRYEKNNAKHRKHHAKVLEPPTPTRNFLNEETEPPLNKPNRRRVLTKPETVSYFKKIIG